MDEDGMWADLGLSRPPGPVHRSPPPIHAEFLFALPARSVNRRRFAVLTGGCSLLAAVLLAVVLLHPAASAKLPATVTSHDSRHTAPLRATTVPASTTSTSTSTSTTTTTPDPPVTSTPATTIPPTTTTSAPAATTTTTTTPPTTTTSAPAATTTTTTTPPTTTTTTCATDPVCP
jgi:cytoskeletal protein RodZ